MAQQEWMQPESAHGAGSSGGYRAMTAQNPMARGSMNRGHVCRYMR